MPQKHFEFNIGDTVYCTSAGGDVFENEVEEYRITKDGIKVWCKDATRLVDETTLFRTRHEALYDYCKKKEEKLCKELLNVRAEIERLEKQRVY